MAGFIFEKLSPRMKREKKKKKTNQIAKNLLERKFLGVVLGVSRTFLLSRENVFSFSRIELMRVKFLGLECLFPFIAVLLVLVPEDFASNWICRILF